MEQTHRNRHVSSMKNNLKRSLVARSTSQSSASSSCTVSGGPLHDLPLNKIPTGCNAFRHILTANIFHHSKSNSQEELREGVASMVQINQKVRALMDELEEKRRKIEVGALCQLVVAYKLETTISSAS